MNFANTNS